MVNRKMSRRLFGVSALAVLVVGLWMLQAESSGAVDRDFGGGRDVARTSVRSADINDVNVNKDVNVNVDHGGCCFDTWGHPVATTAAVATGIAVGAAAASAPQNCTPVVTDGVTTQSCNGTYYRPIYQGTSVQYQVISQP